MHSIPDVFEIPNPRGGRLAAWLAVLAMTAIVVGATAGLVAVNYVPHGDFQAAADP